LTGGHSNEQKLSRQEKTANNERAVQLKEKDKFLPRELFLGSTKLGGKLVLTGRSTNEGRPRIQKEKLRL
jgi:hypothetical protein